MFSKTAVFCFTYCKELILYYLANKFMLVAVVVYKKKEAYCCTNLLSSILSFQGIKLYDQFEEV